MQGKAIYLAAALALAFGATAHADATSDTAPVKKIGVYVTPYYFSADTPDGQPQVAVAAAYDALLASNKREDIVAVRDAIQANPNLITPMTLMVLSIRLYDVGLRDDAVFWFYVAKNRYLTTDAVLNMRSPSLASARVSIKDFHVLVGPFINSYAFCDLAKREVAAVKAIDWVEAHPYQVLFNEQIPALAGDRAENLQKAIQKLRKNHQEEQQFIADPKNLEQMMAKRQENHVPEQFCWRD